MKSAQAIQDYFVNKIHFSYYEFTILLSSLHYIFDVIFLHFEIFDHLFPLHDRNATIQISVCDKIYLENCIFYCYSLTFSSTVITKLGMYFISY